MNGNVFHRPNCRPYESYGIFAQVFSYYNDQRVHVITKHSHFISLYIFHPGSVIALLILICNKIYYSIEFTLIAFDSIRIASDLLRVYFSRQGKNCTSNSYAHTHVHCAYLKRNKSVSVLFRTMAVCMNRNLNTSENTSV